MINIISNLTAAYMLDLLLGDPQWMPHPVRFIGFLIARGEKWFRKLINSELIAGGLLTCSLIFIFYLSTALLLRWISAYSLILSGLIEIIILYFCLSTKDLAVQSQWVQEALQAGDLVRARQKLSWIVGRDTDQLDEKEIIRGTVETVAENTVDGVIAPIFFAVLGGAPLAAAYKTINTLDSMIGHRNEKYLFFGRAAAKIDTWANWIPARISGLLFPAAAWVLSLSTAPDKSGNYKRFDAQRSYETAWKQGAKSSTPNAGIPEGAMAGALQVQLGGLNYYQRQPISAPLLGKSIQILQPNHIQKSIRMLYITSFLSFVLGLGMRFVIEEFWAHIADHLWFL